MNAVMRYLVPLSLMLASRRTLTRPVNIDEEALEMGLSMSATRQRRLQATA